MASETDSCNAMRLTGELAAKVAVHAGELDLISLPDNRRFACDDDHEAIVASLLENRPAGEDVWIFGYGSLIWKAAFEHDAHITALLEGWQRSFCLGWDCRFRGCKSRPGLMLALDKGDFCHGVAYRLKRGAVLENMKTLVQREMRLLPHPFPPRWVKLRTPEGQLDAITFIMDRHSGLYVGDLSEEATVDMLATAVGEWGSMAEYLHNTVSHLEQLGIRDSHLWRLQELVAQRLEAEFSS